MSNERPTSIHVEDKPASNHFTHVIQKSEINSNQIIKVFDNLCINWAGEICQPSFRVPSTSPWRNTYLSFEGYAQYLPPYSGSFPHIQTDHVVMPNNGELFTMEIEQPYFLNANDPAVSDKRYAINKNSTSIIINNASISNGEGEILMLNMRASFEGNNVQSPIEGMVVILCNMIWVTINNLSPPWDR